MTQPKPTHSRRASQRWIGRILRWVLLAVVLALAGHFLVGIDWPELGTRIRSADPRWIAVAVGCLLLRWAVWGQRWRLAVLRLGKAPGVARLFGMVMASAALNHITPAARVLGGLLRARYLSHQTTYPAGQAFGTVLFDQLVHQVSVAAMTVLALAAASWSLGRHALTTGTLIVAVVLAGAVVLTWHRMRRGGGKRLADLARRLAERAQRRGGTAGESRANQVLDHGREAVSLLRRLLANGPLLGLTLSLGVLYALVNAAALWTVFWALDSQVGFAVALASVSLGVAAGALLGTPGGIGTAEAAIVTSLVALGIDQVAATAAALLYRGLHYITVFGIGLPALAVLELRRKRQLQAVQNDSAATG